jgi:hypothetical protein
VARLLDAAGIIVIGHHGAVLFGVSVFWPDGMAPDRGREWRDYIT